jgi:hypothetical protein
MFSKFSRKLKDQANPPLEPKSTCEEAQIDPHVVMWKEKITMHDTNLLDNESAHSLSRSNTTLLDCASGFGSSKPHTTTTPYEKLGTKNTTLVKPTPQIPIKEGKNWVVLVPKSSPSNKLFNKKRLVGMKSPSKFGVVEGQVVGRVSIMPKLCCTYYVATPLWPSVGVKPNTWKSGGFGVLWDSRMFRARQKGAKHLALDCSWCHWKVLET